jgi:DNA polymerase-3 subunit alpha
MEVFMASKLLSYDRMEQLSGILGRSPGLDHVELLVSNVNGETMRMELPTRVDGRNMVMAAEVRDLVGEEGSIQFA